MDLRNAQCNAPRRGVACAFEEEPAQAVAVGEAVLRVGQPLSEEVQGLDYHMRMRTTVSRGKATSRPGVPGPRGSGKSRGKGA